MCQTEEKEKGGGKGCVNNKAKPGMSYTGGSCRPGRDGESQVAAGRQGLRQEADVEGSLELGGENAVYSPFHSVCCDIILMAT